jgi:hypothetical protein
MRIIEDTQSINVDNHYENRFNKNRKARRRSATRCVFVDVVEGEKVDGRQKVVKTLTLIAELGEAKSTGQPFLASVTYNLDDRRGNKRAREDLARWRENESMGDINEFDPEAEYLGKSFIGNVEQTQDSGTKFAKLKSCKPDPDEKVNPSGKFVRAKDKAAAQAAVSITTDSEEKPVQKSNESPVAV